jgi:hypothetical protein
MASDPKLTAVSARKLTGGERFTIADATGLVAATAIGLALARHYWEQLGLIYQAGRAEYVEWVYRGALLVLPLSAALAWSRSRRPWRPARRLAREPGAVALLATAASRSGRQVQ